MFISHTSSWARRAINFFDISYKTNFSFKYTIRAIFEVLKLQYILSGRKIKVSNSFIEQELVTCQNTLMP